MLQVKHKKKKENKKEKVALKHTTQHKESCSIKTLHCCTGYIVMEKRNKCRRFTSTAPMYNGGVLNA